MPREIDIQIVEEIFFNLENNLFASTLTMNKQTLKAREKIIYNLVGVKVSSLIKFCRPTNIY